jgi:hypothetical protein
MTWNTNCYLSKQVKARGKTLKVTNQLFLMMSGGEVKRQYTLFQFLSPTKLDIVLNVFINSKNEQKRTSMTMLEKLNNDSTTEELPALEKLHHLLHTPAYRDKKVYYTGDCEIKDERFIRIDDVIGDIDLLEEMKVAGASVNKKAVIHLDERPRDECKDDEKPGRKFQADFDNTMAFSLTMCSYLARDYKLV